MGTKVLSEPREVPATGAKSNRRASWLTLSVAFMIAGIFAGMNLSTWYTRITYPGQESYEGVPLVEMAHLRQGTPIYDPPRASGFADASYGPLYYLLGSRLINPNHPSYLPLRLLSALAILACAALCGFLAFRLTQRFAAAFLGPLVFLSYGMVTGHGIEALSDAVALLLFFSAFLVAYRFRNSRAILLAAPLMVMAFYYKPQYIAGPVAVLAFLVLEKKYWLAIQFGGLLALFGLGLLGIFQCVVFAGQAFWRHFLFYQSSLLQWDRFEHGVLVFAVMLLAPVVLSAAYLRSHPNKLLACYLITAVVMGLVTYGKAGSGIHYFFETVLIISVLVPSLLVIRSGNRTAMPDMLVLLGAVLLLGQFGTQTAPQPTDFAQYHAFESFIRINFPAHSPTLDVMPGDMLQAGMATPFSGLDMLSALAHTGRASDRGLVARINNRKFAVIVLTFNLEKEKEVDWLNLYLTEPMRRAISSNYRIKAALHIPEPERLRPHDRFYVYVPR